MLCVMATLLFLPARTVSYWQAWVFLAVFGASALAITLYLKKNDPKLLERRVSAGPSAEKDWSQKIIQTTASTGFAAILVVSALDHRFAWTPVPLSVCLAGGGSCGVRVPDCISRLQGKYVCFGDDRTRSRTESHFNGAIQTGTSPDVSGSFSSASWHTLSLGSWWGLLVIALMMPALIWRLIAEEKFLAKNLAGYTAYQKAVRYRLMPFIW